MARSGLHKKIPIISLNKERFHGFKPFTDNLETFHSDDILFWFVV